MKQDGFIFVKTVRGERYSHISYSTNGRFSLIRRSTHHAYNSHFVGGAYLKINGYLC